MYCLSALHSNTRNDFHNLLLMWERKSDLRSNFILFSAVLPTTAHEQVNRSVVLQVDAPSIQGKMSVPFTVQSYSK